MQVCITNCRQENSYQFKCPSWKPALQASFRTPSKMGFLKAELAGFKTKKLMDAAGEFGELF